MNVYIYCYLLAGQTFGFDILIDSCKYIFWKVNGCAELPARSTRKKWKKNEIKNEWMDGLICIYLSAFPTDEHDIWLIYFLFMVLFAANSRYFRINIRGIFSYLLATKTKSFLWWCLDQKWKPGSFLIWEVLYSAFALSPFGGWGVNNKNGWQVLLE